MIFPSADGMRRCSQYLRHNVTDIACPIYGEISVGLPQQAEASTENAVWARFWAVLFRDSEQATNAANAFWGFMGDGISSRHAEFCLQRLTFMSCVSLDSLSNDFLQTYRQSATSADDGQVPPVPWDHSDADTKSRIKALIAKLVTSDKAGQEAVRPQDVFLYPKGMCAIGTVARQLVPPSTDSSEAVVFGLAASTSHHSSPLLDHSRLTRSSVDGRTGQRQSVSKQADSRDSHSSAKEQETNWIGWRPRWRLATQSHVFSANCHQIPFARHRTCAASVTLQTNIRSS
ncbi:hypothetical protein V8C42DRAFT_207717 [Trichoderma barbatum]